MADCEVRQGMGWPPDGLGLRAACVPILHRGRHGTTRLVDTPFKTTAHDGLGLSFVKDAITNHKIRLPPNLTLHGILWRRFTVWGIGRITGRPMRQAAHVEVGRRSGNRCREASVFAFHHGPDRGPHRQCDETKPNETPICCHGLFGRNTCGHRDLRAFKRFRSTDLFLADQRSYVQNRPR